MWRPPSVRITTGTWKIIAVTSRGGGETSALNIGGITATGVGMRDVDTDHMATGREDMSMAALQDFL